MLMKEIRAKISWEIMESADQLGQLVLIFRDINFLNRISPPKIRIHNWLAIDQSMWKPKFQQTRDTILLLSTLNFTVA